MGFSFRIRVASIIFFLSVIWVSAVNSQTYDTISNWDGITRDWAVYFATGEVVDNPAPDTVNSSEKCFKLVTSEVPHNYISCELDNPVDFDANPRYRIKVLAPETGGDVLLKFESEDCQCSSGVVATPVPGQWTDLVFDFSGMAYDNLTRMQIFCDLDGEEEGNEWYIDDILMEVPDTLVLETHFPIFVINTYGVSIPDDPKVDGHLGIIWNGNGNINKLTDPFNHYDGFIGIEVRGQSSQIYPKKSYSFETRDADGENLNVPLLGLPKENDWVLYAPFPDKTMLRNLITFEMARKMEGYASRARFCEVVVNGDYKGVYVLLERIKQDKNRLNIAKLKPETVSGENLTGGYIVRVEKIKPDYIPDEHGWDSPVVPPYPDVTPTTFQYFYPKIKYINQPQREYIRDYINEAEAVLAGDNFLDRETGYIKFMDAPSFAEMLLINEVSKDVDNYQFSTYFYKHRDSDGGKLFAGPPWDFNFGYGNVEYWPEGADAWEWQYALVNNGKPDMMYWWERLMEDEYFVNLVYTRWRGLRESAITNAFFESAIDSLAQELNGPKERNFGRWDILGKYVWPNLFWENNTYEDEVEYFRNYLFNRLQWMDENMPGELLSPWAGISPEGNKLRVQLYGDFFRSPVLKKGDFVLNNAPVSLKIQSVEFVSFTEINLVLSEPPVNYSDLTVTIKSPAINTWEDITTGKLASAGINDPSLILPQVTASYSQGRLVIHTDMPEIMPASGDIFNLAGQHVATVKLEKSPVNSVSVNLKPGVWLLKLNAGGYPQAVRFVVVN